MKLESDESKIRGNFAAGGVFLGIKEDQ